jgi:hypothetical protein
MPNSSEEKSKKKPEKDLLSLYEALSAEYEKILTLSQEILSQFKKETLSTQSIVAQLKQKLEIAKEIAELTNQIYYTRIENKLPSSSEILSQGKKIVEKIKAYADELLLIEDKLEELLKKRGIKIR